MSDKNDSGMTTIPLTPVIGAEIENIDLREDLSEDGFEELRKALYDHQVIFFRDQDITVENQKELGKRFGELVAHPNDPGLEDHPEVMIIHADESSKRIAG